MRIVSLVAVLLFVCACGSDNGINTTPPEAIDYTAQNEKEITDYLTANELVAEKTDSGLHYIIENQGDGAQPDPTDRVVVAYKGYFLNGTVFDESTAEGIDFTLNQVILGWQEGIPLFNAGGTGTIFVPAHLAYGSFDFNGIPGGSVLAFDINLLSVN